MRSPALYEAHRPYWKGEGTEAWKTYRRKRREKARKRREKARKRRKKARKQRLEQLRKSLES
jgi:predicted transposase YbfD/YdcC